MYDLCAMDVYKVIFDNDSVVGAIPTSELRHGDICLKDDKMTVEWYALECPDKETAIEIAGQVIKAIWKNRNFFGMMRLRMK